MSQLENDINQVELSIEVAEEVIKKGKQAEALAKIKDFKEIILDGYFVDEAARLVHYVSHPTTSEEDRKQALRDIDGIGSLKRHLNMLVTFGKQAQEALEADKNTLEELRQADFDESNGEG